MPKPQHVDDRLYDNIVLLLFSQWLLSYSSICPALCSRWKDDPNLRPYFENLRNELKEMENQPKVEL